MSSASRTATGIGLPMSGGRSEFAITLASHWRVWSLSIIGVVTPVGGIEFTREVLRGRGMGEAPLQPAPAVFGSRMPERPSVAAADADQTRRGADQHYRSTVALF